MSNKTNTMNLIALCVITIGMAEQRDREGKLVSASTLRDIAPGEPLTIDAEEGLKLLNRGAARLPLVEGDANELKQDDGKAAKAPRAKAAKAAAQGTSGDGGGGETAGAGGDTGGADGDGEAGTGGDGDGQGAAATGSLL